MAVTPVRRGPPHRPRRNLFPELTVRRNLEQNARSALAVSDDGIVLEQGRLALGGSADEITADRRAGALLLAGGVWRVCGRAGSSVTAGRCQGVGCAG